LQSGGATSSAIDMQEIGAPARKPSMVRPPRSCHLSHASSSALPASLEIGRLMVSAEWSAHMGERVWISAGLAPRQISGRPSNQFTHLYTGALLSRPPPPPSVRLAAPTAGTLQKWPSSQPVALAGPEFSCSSHDGALVVLAVGVCPPPSSPGASSCVHRPCEQQVGDSQVGRTLALARTLDLPFRLLPDRRWPIRRAGHLVNGWRS
jgi:hypothetical protein